MNRRAFLPLLLAAQGLPAAPAPDPLISAKRNAVLTHARIVHATYTDTLTAARLLSSTLRAFVKSPGPDSLAAARAAWSAARLPYGRSEVFRYYAGPIDDADGPEPLLNSWPLDESWIDPPPGSPDPGIIGSPDRYPTLSPQSIAELNQQDGEKNIACGWHAIEFLLWGPDSSKSGPGNRPWTDFSSAPHASRRATYLLACADIITAYLEDLVQQWAPDNLGNYRAVFEEGIDASIERILMGIIFLSGTELAGERLQVAWDTQEQEDEQSCFSDTTHLDLIANTEGIAAVWNGTCQRPDGTTLSGTGLKAVASLADPALANAISSRITTLLTRARAIPPPFDTAIRGDDNAPGRKAVFSLITAAEDVAIKSRELATALNCRIPDVPPEDIEG
jgi:putative iron-regulated protein